VEETKKRARKKTTDTAPVTTRKKKVKAGVSVSDAPPPEKAKKTSPPIQKTRVKKEKPAAPQSDKRMVNCQLPGAELLSQGKSVAEVMETLEKELSPQHERFCREYIIDENGTRAYMRAYPKSSYDSARNSASELLAKPCIKARIEELRDERNRRLEISSDKVLRKLAALIHFDPRDLYDETGALKPIHELDYDVALAIQSIEVDEIMSGRGEDRTSIGQTKKVKFVGIRETLELAGRYLKLWKDVGSADNPVKGDITVKDMTPVQRAARVGFLLRTAKDRAEGKK
jgi:phage terminase small subunit